MKETLVSAIVISSNVFAPVNVWAVERSAKVIVPVGIVAVVPPAPVVKVTALVPETPKFPPRVNVPVVQVGAPVPPETNACPVDPTADNSNESASEYTIAPASAVISLLVPPEDKGRIPETSPVNETADQVGALVPFP